MIGKYETKVVTINKPLKQHKAGELVHIKVDKNGIPLDRYWRDRLKDSEIDGCIKLENKVTPKKKAKNDDKK